MTEYIEKLRKEFYSNSWEDCKLCKFAAKQPEPIVGFVFYPKKMYVIIDGITTQI